MCQLPARCTPITLASCAKKQEPRGLLRRERSVGGSPEPGSDLTGAERPDRGQAAGRGPRLHVVKMLFHAPGDLWILCTPTKIPTGCFTFFFLEETVESILKFEWKYRRPGQARATAKRGTDTVGRRTSDSGHCDQTVAAVEAARPQTKGGRSIDAREQRVPKKSPRERKTGFRERSKARPRRKVILSTNAAGKIGMQGGKSAKPHAMHNNRLQMARRQRKTEN